MNANVIETLSGLTTRPRDKVVSRSSRSGLTTRAIQICIGELQKIQKVRQGLETRLSHRVPGGAQARASRKARESQAAKGLQGPYKAIEGFIKPLMVL